jgi:uncharacterized protein (DUF1778 family)
MAVKTEKLTFRLSKQDKEQIKERANQKRLTTSSYVLTELINLIKNK